MSEPPAIEPTYTVQEVADLLGLHEHTIRRWIKAGQLPAIRPGTRAWRIRASVVEALMTGDLQGLRSRWSAPSPDQEAAS
jgi:excisionase family DNA binding protein